MRATGIAARPLALLLLIASVAVPGAWAGVGAAGTDVMHVYETPAGSTTSPAHAHMVAFRGYDPPAQRSRSGTPSIGRHLATKVGARTAGALSDDVAKTFKGSAYTTRTLDEDLVLRRVYGGASGQLGPYWSRTAYSSSGRAKQYLALPDANTAERVATIRVPAGTAIHEGKAAAAFGRRGGGNQVYIPRVDPRWIQP